MRSRRQVYALPCTVMCLSLFACNGSHYNPSQSPKDFETDRRIAELEAEVTRLRTTGTNGPAVDVQPSRIPLGKESWRRLRPGMTFNEVRATLGEPSKIDTQDYSYWRTTYWYYSDSTYSARVEFKDSKVCGWNEP